MQVRSAVIPAAGMGTRFLPASKAVPKELMPIGDTPALQLVIDEALGAGIDHIVVVSSKGKPAIEAYFEPSPEVVDTLEASGRKELADRIRGIGADWQVTVVYQDVPKGLGHAVGCAREAVGDQPFAVLLPDELMGDSSLLAHLNGICVSTGGSVVGLKEVPPEDVSSYGVIDPAGPVDADGVVAIRDMVEKPPAGEAPSNLIIIGRYVLTPDVFDEIAGLAARTRRGDPAHRRPAGAGGAGSVPRGGEPARPLRHRQPARVPHRGDRAQPAPPGDGRRAAGVPRRPEGVTW